MIFNSTALPRHLAVVGGPKRGAQEEGKQKGDEGREERGYLGNKGREQKNREGIGQEMRAQKG